MKIIFLDMDGVMNSAYSNNMKYIEKDMYIQLKRIVDITDAKVVLSTSWREFPDWKRFLTDFFACWDIDVVGATPVLKDRPDEILTYLSEHSEEIESFVILDDWDMTKEFPNNMVWTIHEGRCGLDEHLANKAIEILEHKVTNERVDDET